VRLSTFGRDRDQAAATIRRERRRLAKEAITRDYAVRFSIETLTDPTVDAAEACALVLTALTLKEF
jgi:hypothetical protein